jgi:hypothetical protein
MNHRAWHDCDDVRCLGSICFIRLLNDDAGDWLDSGHFYDEFFIFEIFIDAEHVLV